MARRQTTTFSMSFLDVISCGFGAVVLFYTIISAQAGLFRIKENTDLNSESRRLEQEVLDGYKHLAELRSALDATEDRKARAAGVSRETPLPGFFAQARSLRLADGPDEVHKGLIARIELGKRGLKP